MRCIAFELVARGLLRRSPNGCNQDYQARSDAAEFFNAYYVEEAGYPLLVELQPRAPQPALV